MQKKPRNGWAILFALYYYSIVASYNLLKVPPLFGLLMPEFGLDASNVGIIVSASSIAGLLLVFPSAFIARRLGTRRCGLIAITCSITGCVLGALAPSLPVLMVARFIEGCGLGMTGVVCSTTIPQYFKGKKMGLPMSIWSTWFAVGSAVGSMLSSKIGYGFNNWRASWWAGAILAAIGFVVFALVVYENKDAQPAHSHAEPVAQPLPGEKQPGFWVGVKNLRIWLISLYFAALLICCVGFLSFATEFFSSVYGMAKADAGSLASLGYWFAIVGGIAAGVVSRLRKTNSLRGQFVQLVLCAALCIAVYPFGFLYSQKYIIIFLFGCGFLNGYTCGVVMSTVPRLVSHPRVAGVSMGIIFVGQNLSSLTASLIVGSCIEGGNWSNAVLPLLGITIFGLVCAVGSAIFSLRKEKKMQQAALPTQETFGALKAEVEQLKQELEASAASLQTAREENAALQREYTQTQETLAALQSEIEELHKAIELAQAEANQHLQDAKLAVERELKAMREVQELKHQLNVLKRMNPIKRMLWKG